MAAQARFWRSIAEVDPGDDDARAPQQSHPQPHDHGQGHRDDRVHGDDPAAPLSPLPLSRRGFLGIMGASLAMAGATGCSRPPLETIVPYHDGPAEQTYGKPVFYASALECGGDALGVLVECNMGRPTKIEGNPDHPASLGATNVAAQAAVLELWDPERSQQVRRLRRPATWGDAAMALRERMAVLAPRAGEGLAVLTEPIASPSLEAAIAALQASAPRAAWHAWSPLMHDAAAADAASAPGMVPRYRFDRARTILTLDADFLGGMPGHVRYAHDFAATRRAETPAAERSRLYAIECVPSLTGAAADHRLALRGSDILHAARAIAHAMGANAAAPARDVLPAAWLDAVVHDLRDSGAAALVVAGDRQPVEVHALARAVNARLGALGHTVLAVPPSITSPHGEDASLAALVARMRAGAVDSLLILGGNPVYAAPADLDFAAALAKVPFSLHLGLYDDETAEQCTWHIPAAHPLETWGDVRSVDGTVALQQPCIAPLYDGKSAHQVLAALRGDATASARDLVLAHWTRALGAQAAAGIDDALRRGRVAGTGAGAAAAAPAPDRADTRAGEATAPSAGASSAGAASAASPAPASPAPTSPDAVELVFVPDPRVHDGRYANNAWLQELPKPLSQLTWDNAAEMSPALAARLGVANEEHVDIALGGRSVVAPVWIMPGMPDGTIALALGYGRRRAGSVGNGRGFDAYRLRTASAPWIAPGASVRRAAGRTSLACTQTHSRMEGRDIIRTVSVVQAAACTPQACGTPDVRHQRTLYDSPPQGPYAWAMSIDLSACIGCGTCTVACQAENNIPTVGKEEVGNGREMHWIRVDRYYQGEPASPRTAFQPVPCMQCEHAPCVVVCPVEASVHDSQGINVQVYNRCVGTRFCSNNCPYKVRRFNFFQYTRDVPQLDAQRNPEVTVRSRGVMEKCNYCLQRITTARIAADREGRSLRDGEVVTACQAACPTRAIVFGDLNVPDSAVNRRKALPLDYVLLAELNTRPRTSYVARIVNRTAALEAPAAPPGKV
jgi:molybdopterin-containing oxidoreductase family iron-sulfur binding subunit